MNINFKTEQVVAIGLIILIGAGSLRAQQTGTFTDSRDGKTYKTVKIGNQIWMAENLNYATKSGSWCYDNNNSNCLKYGRLYDWETAQNACPEGWHLPTSDEFEILLQRFSGEGKNLYRALLDGGSSGFSALIGGQRNTSGRYESLHYASFHTATHDVLPLALSISDRYKEARLTAAFELDALSVRCVTDGKQNTFDSRDIVKNNQNHNQPTVNRSTSETFNNKKSSANRGATLYSKADKSDYNDQYKEISTLDYTDGKIILVKKINIKDSRTNPDRSLFYKTTFAIIIAHGDNIKINEIETDIYTNKEYNNSMMPCMLYDPEKNAVTVFANGKNSEKSNYGMEGFAYRLDLNSKNWTKEVVFDRANSGWYSFFGGSDNGNPVLWHFSFGGHLAIRSTRNNNGTWTSYNISNYDPSKAANEYPYRQNILVTSFKDVDRMTPNVHRSSTTSTSPQFSENEIALGAAIILGAVLWQGAKWVLSNSGSSSSSYSNNLGSSGSTTQQKCYEYIETNEHHYCGFKISTYKIRCLKNGTWKDGTKYHIFYYPGGKGDCIFNYSEGWYQQGTDLSSIGNWSQISIDKKAPYEEAVKKHCGCN